MKLEVLLILFIFGAHSLAAQDNKSIDCDTVFSYRGASHKYGIVDFRGNIVLKPTFLELDNFSHTHSSNVAIFRNRDLSIGIVDSKGEILIDGLEGVVEFKFNKKESIVYFSHSYQDVSVFSIYRKELIGFYPNCFAAISQGADFLDRVVVINRMTKETTCINEFGDDCLSSKKRAKTFCKQWYQVELKRGIKEIKVAKNNIETYQLYFPSYKVIEEYFSREGSISILVSKDGKFGLINSNGEILLELAYDFISFNDGLLKLSKDYAVGLMDVYGDMIYEPQFNYIKLNDPDQGYLLVGTKNQCEGLADLFGNIFLPKECK